MIVIQQKNRFDKGYIRVNFDDVNYNTIKIDTTHDIGQYRSNTLSIIYDNIDDMYKKDVIILITGIIYNDISNLYKRGNFTYIEDVLSGLCKNPLYFRIPGSTFNLVALSFINEDKLDLYVRFLLPQHTTCCHGLCQTRSICCDINYIDNDDNLCLKIDGSIL